ncbi:MAG: hypothetical protein LBB31_03010, partial [Prevotellaceae bacterium]|nr:hypothetical protein [Prevotellaceae bacterium]
MRTLLIDTQSFIWFVENDERLPATVRAFMNDSYCQLTISIACLWEMTIKMSLSKLAISNDIATMINKALANG